MENVPQVEDSPKIANLVSQGLAITKIENENQMQIAVQRPRNIWKVHQSVFDELTLVPEFAAKSFYSIPYKNDMGGTTYVEGPSIKAAMGLARQWGNCSNSGRIVEDLPDRVIVEGVFIDYETGFRTLRQVSVARGYWSKQIKKVVPLREDRLNMAIQAGISKAVRNAILASLPVSLVEKYIKRSKEVASAHLGGNKEVIKSVSDRLSKAKEMFFKLGVSEVQWNIYLSQAGLEGQDLVDHLIGLFSSIQDDIKTVDEVFGEKVATTEVKEEQIKSSELFNDKPESKKPRKV